MKQKKQLMKTTAKRRVFNLVYKSNIKSKNGLCSICNMHSGCNYWYRSKPQKNWKAYRNKQYKMKKLKDFA